MKIPPITMSPYYMEEDSPYTQYCEFLNGIVRKMAQHGQIQREPYCTIMTYQDVDFRLTYTQYDSGNEHYLVEVHRNTWNSIPQGVNPFMVNENGPWNFVYQYNDSRNVLMFHIPGSWSSVLAELRKC